MLHPYPVRVALFAAGGGLLCLLAVTVWLQSNPELFPQAQLWVWMPVATAIAVGFQALALIGCALGAVLLPLAAALIVALISAANLAWALFPDLLDFSMSLFDGLRWSGEDSEPMISLTAIGLLFAAALMPPLVMPANVRRISALGVGSTLVLVIALVSLSGYVTGHEPTRHWLGFDNMEIISALALAIIGGTGMFAAIHGGRCLPGDTAISWPPLALALGAILMTGFLYVALANAQTNFVTRVVKTDAHSIAREIDRRFADMVQGAVRAVRRLQRDDTAIGVDWLGEVGTAIFQDSYRGLAWLGPDLEPQMLRAWEDGGHRIERRLILQATEPWQFERAAGLGIYAVSEPIPLGDEEMGFYLFMPALRDGSLLGFLAVAYAIDAALVSPLSGVVERGAVVQVLYGGRVIFQDGPAGGEAANNFFKAVIDDVGPGWTLSLTPTEGLVSQYRNALPETVMVLGTLLVLLTAFLMRTRQQLTSSNTQVTELNEGLERKVRDRTEALIREVSERERIAANLAHASKHDALTGLPNRALFDEHLIHAMSNARRRSGLLAVMFVDLDNFKDVNDSLGHPIGDALLRNVAGRMRDSLRASDVVARPGGDEFLVLAETLAEPADAGGLAAKLSEALGREFRIGEHRVHVSASIGISLFPDRTGFVTDAATIIKNADAAMYQAKHNGKNRFEFHSPALQARIRERLSIKAALIDALERQQLEVYYQPRLDLKTRKTLGAEALVRWNRPRTGYISPAVFIPIAEETGLVTAVGREVLNQVCGELYRWLEGGDPVPMISVNTSVQQFRDGQLLRQVQECLAPHPLVSAHLELELTERLLIDNRAEYRGLLQQLSSMGIRIAIDDFGTGCASFGYFRNFPIDVVKIDQSFIEHVVDNTHDAMITQTIIDLARNFRLRVVAEGVETEEQFRMLRTAGCHEGQGYLFGRPMPAADFRDYWARGQRVVS